MTNTSRTPPATSATTGWRNTTSATDWADEYVDVAYKLWEGSWDDGRAACRTASRGVHGDYSKIHKIHHVGKRYRVEGPHLVAPSPQRTPVLFQAGSSDGGKGFRRTQCRGSVHHHPRPAQARELIDDTRRRVVPAGRRPGDLKFFQGLHFVVGGYRGGGRRKEAELDHAIDLDGMVAHLSGAVGVDFGGHPLDTPLGDIAGTQGVRSIVTWVQESVSGREATVRDLGLLQGRNSRVVGTPETIADRFRSGATPGWTASTSSTPPSLAAIRSSPIM